MKTTQRKRVEAWEIVTEKFKSIKGREPFTKQEWDTVEAAVNLHMGTKVQRYCEICGEPEGSPYAKHCCEDDDNLAEV